MPRLAVTALFDLGESLQMLDGGLPAGGLGEVGGFG
jgi:hypothetical protein